MRCEGERRIRHQLRSFRGPSFHRGSLGPFTKAGPAHPETSELLLSACQRPCQPWRLADSVRHLGRLQGSGRLDSRGPPRPLGKVQLPG